MAGDTKERILETALALFAQSGYLGTSMHDIAKELGITKGALYKHYASKQAIFDAIVKSTAAQYEADTDKIHIHVQNVQRDIPVFTEITEDALFEKVRQIFEYTLLSVFFKAPCASGCSLQEVLSKASTSTLNAIIFSCCSALKIRCITPFSHHLLNLW